MKISIGNLSKTFGLTKEALHFYEKNGILSPFRDQTNGYRYYTDVDVQKIGTIKKLRNANFTLKDIAHLYHGVGNEEIKAIYKEKIEQMNRTVFFKNCVLEKLNSDFEAFSTAEEHLYQCELVTTKEYYRFAFDNTENLVENKQYRDIASSWFNAMPLASATSLMPFSDFINSIKNISRGLIIERGIADKINLIINENVDILPPYRCVSMLACLCNEALEVEKAKAAITSFAKENRITYKNTIFTVSIFSYANEHNDMISYTRVFLPIEE